jgi:hypothetical protein
MWSSHVRLTMLFPDMMLPRSHMATLCVGSDGLLLCVLLLLQALPHLRVLCASMNQLTSLEPLSVCGRFLYIHLGGSTYVTGLSTFSIL